MSISNKLKKLRIEKGLTQNQLAEAINVSTSIIGDIEIGRRPASKKTAQKLAVYFNTSLEYWLDINSTDEYFKTRNKYAALDNVITALISSGNIKDANLNNEIWDLIKDAVKIDLKVILMGKEQD